MKKCRALLLVFVGIIVLGFSGCSGNTSVNLMDYVQVEFSGVDGQGRAVCTMDLASLEKTLAGDQDGEISTEELSKLAWITQFETSIKSTAKAPDGRLFRRQWTKSAGSIPIVHSGGGFH